MRSRLAFAASLVLWSMAVGPVVADQETARIPIVDAPPGTPGIGGGARLNATPYAGVGAVQDLVPLYLYEGRWVFAHGTSVGVHAFRNDLVSFDVLARYRFQRLDPEDEQFDDPLFQGLDERRQTVDGGVALGFRGGWGEVKLDWVTDLGGHHEGDELGLGYRYSFERGRWNLSPFAAVTRQSRELVRYYFGVSTDEATAERPAYAPGAALNYGLGINTSYRWRRHMLFFVNAAWWNLDTEIGDSPLTDRRRSLTTAFGLAFHAGNLFEPASARPSTPGLWSWRLNYGYQVRGNIVGDVNHGDWEKSSRADTNIGGFTVGRRVIDGERIDFFARLALYRHLEEPFQEDFFSFAGWVEAKGYGYFKWSDEPSFRYGFGFGFNYAQSVPAEEQVKAEEKGRNTNQFLNYLEMSVDFPLSKITKARPLRNCWVGLTIVHRSGIFSTADLLGNVFGGSDWLNVHWECLL
jgi:outer membrane scaffolding protein for murein synthesis (MipA/OmpV family)